MATPNRRRAGFTLVELMMVAVILAILAVVVIPQFSDASADVKLSALRATLQTVRAQLELYKSQHGGVYPPADSFATEMCLPTTAPDGSTVGPYLQQMPVNPMDNSTAITTVNQDGSGGWYYKPETGLFKANDDSILAVDSKSKDM